jgi:hydrogenase maturation protease
MSDPVERVASALLYEGYVLYPYRASSVKNRERFNWGVLYPEAYSSRQTGADLCEMRTECLVTGGAAAALLVKVRFLHLVVRTADGATPPWQEALEREVTVAVGAIGELVTSPRLTRFGFPADDRVEGEVRRRQERLDGEIVISARSVAADLHRVTIQVANATAWGAAGDVVRNDVLPYCLASAHTILRVEGGEFVSLLDPPAELREQAADCRNVGAWPVLAGDEGARDTMLSSPIIVYDYPRIAPESAGDLFDATEIDEILSLRILTLTEEEKREIRETDERARLLLERTESLAAEQLLRLHGTLRR